MTQAPELPLHMRRDGFRLGDELTGLREGAGIRKIDTAAGLSAWLVTRQADVRAVMGDPATFSNDLLGAGISQLGVDLSPEERKVMRAGNLLGFDPPDHARLRKILAGEFTVRRMRRLEPRVAEIVGDHLDAMERKGPPADLVADFALPIPSLVICELLGVPYDERDEFQARTGTLLDVTVAPRERMAVSRSMREYMKGLITRARKDPGEDLIGMLVREHGDDLDTEELAGMCNLLLIAGHETTANMLGLGTLALLRHPEQLELLRTEPERFDNAVEELLRYLSIVHASTTKIVTRDTEVAGQPIAAGELVLCSLPAANRDAAVTADADDLDVARTDTTHVAFGYGIHHCLGAPLARMEMRTAFPALLARFPNLRLAPGADPAFRSSSVVYGVVSLPIEW